MQKRQGTYKKARPYNPGHSASPSPCLRGVKAGVGVAAVGVIIGKKSGYRSIISLFFVVFAVFVRGDAEFLFELFYKIGKGVVTRFGANFERGH